MQTINVTGAKYYIAETAVPDLQNNRIRVYDFGYGPNTTCSYSTGGIITCEEAYNHARNGTAIVYVPSGTSAKNTSFVPDTEPLNNALILVSVTAILLFAISKSD